MKRTDVEIAKDLYKKLTTRSTGAEIFGGILTATIMALIIFAIGPSEGYAQGVLIFLLVMQGLSVLIKLSGWRSVVLTNREQEILQSYLKINYR